MANQEQIILGVHTRDELTNILRIGALIGDPGARIQFLSGYFLGTSYSESTLKGDSRTPEILVINLQSVDCMTFIEYIEAMRLSLSFPEFISNLKKVRYRSGIVDYHARKHFFTDWKEFHSDVIEDVTESIGGKMAVRVHKKLNEKEDGKVFLEGIEPLERLVTYIPSKSINSRILEAIRPGDYVGIYSPLQGLDVSHTGIIVGRNEVLYFRHASSQTAHRRVVDQEFVNYVSSTPGIVVFRPTDRELY